MGSLHPNHTIAPRPAPDVKSTMNHNEYQAASTDVSAAADDRTDIKKEFTPMQERLHLAPDELTDEEVLRVTHNPFRPNLPQVVTYSSPVSVPMEASNPNTTIDPETGIEHHTVEYRPSNDYHRLVHVVAELQVSEISVAPEYEDVVQIKLCDNLLHNIVHSASIRIPRAANAGGEYQHTVNTFYHDSYRVKDAINISNWDNMVGNRDELTGWSTCLNTYDKLTLPLQFFIEKGESMSIPIHMFQGPQAVKIVITYALSLKDMICMRVKNEHGHWEKIKPYLPYLTIDRPQFTVPTLWGYYRMLPEGQLREEKLHGIQITITDICYWKDTKVNNAFSVDLSNKDLTLRGLRYGFLNTKAQLLNEHSNYTVNHENKKDGAGPQDTYGLTYGSVPRVTSRSSTHAEALANYFHFVAAVKEKGIYDIAFDFTPYSLGPDTTVVFSETSILSGTLRTKSCVVETVPRRHQKPKYNEDPEELIKNVLAAHRQTYSEDERSGKQCQIFLFKGYTRQVKQLIFRVGYVEVLE